MPTFQSQYHTNTSVGVSSSSLFFLNFLVGYLPSKRCNNNNTQETFIPLYLTQLVYKKDVPRNHKVITMIIHEMQNDMNELNNNEHYNHYYLQLKLLR